MKYKLINRKTNEETICEKVVVDGYDYYVNINSTLRLNDFVYLDNSIKELPDYKGKHIIQLLDKTLLDSANALNTPKSIATNNPNIDIPKVIDGHDDFNLDSEISKLNTPERYDSANQRYNYSESDIIMYMVLNQEKK